MWYPHAVTVAPTSEPVTFEDAGTWARVEDPEDTDRLEAVLASAREWVEKNTGTFLAEQTVAIKCDQFADFEILPIAPVQSITITYVDTEGANQTLATSVYELRADGLETSIVLKYGQAWPSVRPGSRITVTAVCGYAGDVPAPVLQAIRLFAQHEFDGTRTSEIMERIYSLLANDRRFLN